VDCGKDGIRLADGDQQAKDVRHGSRFAKTRRIDRNAHIDAPMIRTFGLTHIALRVRDVERSSRFYRDVFGSVEVYRRAGFAQLQTPGARDVLVLEEAPDRAGLPGGVVHFGFRLISADDIDLAREAVERAGGAVREQGEFVPGEPYLFALDPDGYEFEIWYEIPTPVDPPA
jgi:catechol 2,3-dioxygenase-like lactoylglutathione lyase family enzyme